MLKDFVKPAQPEEAEFKKELKEAQEKLAGYQMQIKEAKLPVMVIFEGWGAAGKGSVVARVIKNIDTSLTKPEFKTELSGSVPVVVGDTFDIDGTATSTDGGIISYQWYRNNVNSNGGGTPIQGANAAIYTAEATEEGSVFYYVVAANNHGENFNSVASGHQKGIDYTFTQQNNEATGLVNTTLTSLGYPQSTGETWTDEWDYVTLGAETSTSFGTGLSITYKYKSNFSWRLFCDYDYSKKTYTLTADPYHYFQKMLTYGAYDLVSNPGLSPFAYQIPKSVFKKDKKMNYWTIGLSLASRSW